ncbi:MAG: hypothetical protein ROZ09_05170 [Thiobacillus sp.]|jgi:hypothetical protein|uniref:hypothetical protein n=1 Tax=Thiobacillus sp. TaxID=924 RepID=UPI00289494A9|nr:hypothetical protein [Thiobacillus sp.]MDT3706195.1 hypothetical protein [Thiobacillus sp.]
MSDPVHTAGAASRPVPPADGQVANAAAISARSGVAPQCADEASDDEPTFRAWRLYMAACALEFEAGGTGIYQILASSRNRGEWPVPLSLAVVSWE